MPCTAAQDGRVIVESSDKPWPTGRGNGKPLQYSCRENPINSIKRQKDVTLKDEPSKSEGVQYTSLANGSEGCLASNWLLSKEREGEKEIREERRGELS